MMDKKQDIVGYAGLGVSVMGVIVSVAMNNPIFASIPLTVGIGCNLASRKQLTNSFVEAYNRQEQTINQLMATLEANHSELTTKLTGNQTDLANRVQKLQL